MDSLKILKSLINVGQGNLPGAADDNSIEYAEGMLGDVLPSLTGRKPEQQKSTDLETETEMSWTDELAENYAYWKRQADKRKADIEYAKEQYRMNREKNMPTPEDILRLQKYFDADTAPPMRPDLFFNKEVIP